MSGFCFFFKLLGFLGGDLTKFSFILRHVVFNAISSAQSNMYLIPLLLKCSKKGGKNVSIFLAPVLLSCIQLTLVSIGTRRHYVKKEEKDKRKVKLFWLAGNSSMSSLCFYVQLSTVGDFTEFCIMKKCRA